MRGIRRLAVYGAVTGLLAAGAVSASMGVAHADTLVQFCDGNSGDGYSCPVTGTVASPSAITVSVSATPNEEVTVSVTALSCTDSTGTATEPASSTTGMTPLSDNVLPLPATADGQCTVTANVSLPKADTSPAPFVAELSYTPAAPASPSPTPAPSSTASPVHPVKGYDGKCVDDKGNSSANRAEVVIWSCSGSDQAENWKYSSNELSHNGKCLNDKGDGGSGSKVILYSCNGGSNEKWSELSNGELKLQAHGGTLCLDDPRSSKTNGTQLIVYTCKDSANQKWSLP